MKNKKYIFKTIQEKLEQEDCCILPDEVADIIPRVINQYIKISEKLNKPEVNICLPLDDKQEGGNGIPPNNELLGILPKEL